LAAQRERASARFTLKWLYFGSQITLYIYIYIYIGLKSRFVFNQVSFKSKFKQYQCKWCLVQSGAGSRFFVAEKNCSTFWILLLALNEMRKKAGLSPYRVPNGILRVINTILYKNEFQNPQNFHLQRICLLFVLTRSGRDAHPIYFLDPLPDCIVSTECCMSIDFHRPHASC
jgi:hypothetical protein